MAKGGSFERQICKKLGLWWTGGEREDIFWRTAGSGARATMRKKQGKKTANQEGDICATDPIGQPLIDIVTIELKCGYNSWTIKELLDSKKKETILQKFFTQCRREQEGRKCVGWWLITRQDRKAEMIFFNTKFFVWLVKRGIKIKRKSHIRIWNEGRWVYCLRLEDFLNMVSPNIFKQ